MSTPAAWFWLAPLSPLAAAVLITLLPRRAPRWLIAASAIGAMALAAVLGLGALAAASTGADATAGARLAWLRTGGYAFSLALRLDALSALLAALVGVVGLAVFVYAARYMADDSRYGRFFATLSLFAAAMLALVLADDALLLFAAWELVGFCSYLLIGFWFERPGVPRAATQAFLVTRVADAALLAGLLLLARAAGTASVGGMTTAVRGAGGGGGSLLSIIALLLLVGAMGKSAQLPLQAWLPDAMAGPTPVSALIHSATMVAAGVYLVARFLPVFAASGTLPVVAWVGAATALFGAVAALAQTDLKRLLAYSTMSQLGLMFVGLGTGSVTAGMLLLLGQAFYKSLLFLGAGSIGHALETTEMEGMGGLARRMPVTFATFLLAALALAGLPVTLALPVKDAVLSAAWRASPALFAAALLASLLTALYAARAVALVFFGAPRGAAAEQARESPPPMLAPMLALAVLLIAAAAADSPLFDRPFARLFAAPVPEAATATVLALAVAALGLGLGWAAHRAWPGALLWPPLRPLAPAARAGFGFPALYAAVASGSVSLARGLRTLDQAVFDPLGARLAAFALGAVRWARRADASIFDAAADALTRGVLALLRASRRFDLRRLDAAFDAGALAVAQLGQHLRATQTGRVYNYLLVVFVWGLGALLLVGVALIS